MGISLKIAIRKSRQVKGEDKMALEINQPELLSLAPATTSSLKTLEGESIIRPADSDKEEEDEVNDLLVEGDL